MFGVKAQTSTRFAVKIGLNSSIQSLDVRYGPSPYDFFRKIGFAGAFGIEYFASAYLSAVAQIEYDERGTGVSRHWIYPFTTTEYNRIEYISFPLLARITFTSRKPHPSLFLGPRIDFPIGYHGVSSNQLFNYIYDNLKRPSYGMSLGMGFELFPVTILECRYDFNLGYEYESGDYILRSNTFNISLGYLF